MDMLNSRTVFALMLSYSSGPIQRNRCIGKMRIRKSQVGLIPAWLLR